MYKFTLKPFALIKACILKAAVLTFALSFVFNINAKEGASEGPQLNLQRIKISAGMYQIDTQVALSPAERQIGLMNRPSMPMHEGMLFVFEEPRQQCFWMKNTMLALSIAFVADDGTIVNIDDMKPQTTNSHCSTKEVRYVLEMNQGWFAKRGIKAGFKLTGAPFRTQ